MLEGFISLPKALQLGNGGVSESKPRFILSYCAIDSVGCVPLEKEASFWTITIFGSRVF